MICIFHYRKRALRVEDVQKLATIHHNLAAVVKLVNQIYGFFVMLYFGGIFCFFNLFLFSLVVTKSYYKDLSEVIMMTIVNFEWNVYDIILIITVIHVSTSASGEGRKTRNLIYKIVNMSMDDKLNGRVSELGFCSNINLNFFPFHYS